jgi:hypothetical protein
MPLAAIRLFPKIRSSNAADTAIFLAPCFLTEVHCRSTSPTARSQTGSVQTSDTLTRHNANCAPMTVPHTPLTAQKCSRCNVQTHGCASNIISLEVQEVHDDATRTWQLRMLLLVPKGICLTNAPTSARVSVVTLLHCHDDRMAQQGSVAPGSAASQLSATGTAPDDVHEAST